MRALLFIIFLLPSLCFADYYIYDAWGRAWLVRTSPTYYTQNNSGTTYGTTNNRGTSYNTINNYGNSHTTVNNYGTGRTTVNDYGPGSVTTVNGSDNRTTREIIDSINAKMPAMKADIDRLNAVLRAR